MLPSFLHLSVSSWVNLVRATAAHAPFQGLAEPCLPDPGRRCALPRADLFWPLRGGLTVFCDSGNAIADRRDRSERPREPSRPASGVFGALGEHGGQTNVSDQSAATGGPTTPPDATAARLHPIVRLHRSSAVCGRTGDRCPSRRRLSYRARDASAIMFSSRAVARMFSVPPNHRRVGLVWREDAHVSWIPGMR